VSTVSHRTQKDVVKFIQQHSREGKLQMSLVEIGDSTGYSNATIYRALKRLEEVGIIKIVSADKPTEPNTIIYQGSSADTTSSTANATVEMSQDIMEIAKRLLGECKEVDDRMHMLEQDVKLYRDLQSRIVSIQDLPDGEYQVVLMRKSATIRETTAM